MLVILREGTYRYFKNKILLALPFIILFPVSTLQDFISEFKNNSFNGISAYIF